MTSPDASLVTYVKRLQIAQTGEKHIDENKKRSVRQYVTRPQGFDTIFGVNATRSNKFLQEIYSVLFSNIPPQIFVTPSDVIVGTGQLGTSFNYPVITYYLVFFNRINGGTTLDYNPITNGGTNVDAFFTSLTQMYWRIELTSIPSGQNSQSFIVSTLQSQFNAKFKNNNTTEYSTASGVTHIAPKIAVGLDNGRLVLSLDGGNLPANHGVGLVYGTAKNGSTALGSSSIAETIAFNASPASSGISDKTDYTGVHNKALLIVNNTGSVITSGFVKTPYQLLGS